MRQDLKEVLSMARIRYGQKVSTKLTRAEKQKLSVDVWEKVNILAKETEHLESYLKQLGKDEVREITRKLKSIKTSLENVKVALHSAINVKFTAFLNEKGVKTKTALIKMPRLATPFDALLRDKGLATSVYNVAVASPEGLGYWQKILAWWINRYSWEQFRDAWIQDYFDSSYGYEDEGLGYPTNYALGNSILQRYRDDYEWVVSMKPETAIPGL